MQAVYIIHHMKQKTINLYGDKRVNTIGGTGVDVASQRADDLDLIAAEHIRALSGASPSLFAIDVGCGHGGQAARMAKAGASVIAMDAQDYSLELAKSLERENVPPSRCFFFRSGIESEPVIGPVDVVMCQRMIHYLEHQAAAKALSWFHRISVSGGRMFLSASGLDSELGDGYPARDVPVDHRFAHLSPEMAEKHSILPSVCLYRPEELAELATKAGWIVEQVFTSPFGNIKLVASKP